MQPDKVIILDSFPSPATPPPVVTVDTGCPGNGMVTEPPPISSRPYLQVPPTGSVRNSVLSNFEDSIMSSNPRAVLGALERAVDLLRGQVTEEEERVENLRQATPT